MNSKFSDPHSAGEKQTGEKQVSQSGRVLHGLYNQGGTSYLNCVLQVLFMTKEIHDRLTETETDHVLTQLFSDLQNKTCRTETITRCLGIDGVNEQRDAAYFLMQILRCISKEASEVFQGELKLITTCCQKHRLYNESKKFWIFPLSLKHGPDRTYCVEESFQGFFQPETFTGNNSLLCGACGKKTEAETRPYMSYPPILTVLLKAFDFDVRSDAMSKCPVKVPRSLKIKSKTYELYGIVDHTGNLRGGHYTATILSSEDNTWYQFNDKHVSKLQVHEQPFVHDGYYNSQNAYLLMYRALTSNYIYQVVVNGLRGEEMIIGLCNTEEQMQKMTVLQLKEKIADKVLGHDDVEDLRLIFIDEMLDGDSTLLSSYGIQHMAVIHVVMKLPGGGGLHPPPRHPRRRSIEWFLSF